MKLNFNTLNIPNLMEQISQFNEILFQQISSNKDVELSLEAEFSKNYLLVPLSRVGDGDKAQYKLDFEIIESTVNEKHWISVQDYIDVQRYRQSLANDKNEELLGYTEIQRQLKDCIFFNRFQRSKCFSIYEIIPSMVDQDSETQKVYPEHEDGFNLAESIKHRFQDE